MNPDVPGLEACKRLREVWPAERDRYGPWWTTTGLEEKPYCLHEHPVLLGEGVFETSIRAPTIGEMGEEIQRRGWRLICTLERRDDGVQVWSATLPGRGHGIHEREADARALALAEALENEKGSPGITPTQSPPARRTR